MFNFKNVDYIFKLSSWLGIDAAIFFTSFSRIIQAFGGVLATLFVAKFLSLQEQGYYFTFWSVIAIQIFFELGFNGIITQFSAHEFAKLKWLDHTVEGSIENLSRVSSLFRFALKWNFFIAFSYFLIVLIAGLYFFSKFGDLSVKTWLNPWILLSFFSALNLFITSIISFIEGVGFVKEVSRIKFYQQLFSILAVLGGLFFQFGLFVPVINSLISFLVVFTLIIFKFRKKLLFFWYYKGFEKIDYFKEIFPYQWRIALSWLSGYFIFQLFNPIIFAFKGATVAGQTGMTMAAVMSIQAIPISWMTTKIAFFSSLIASHKYQELDKTFTRTLKQSLVVSIFLFISFLSMIYIFRSGIFGISLINIANRFLSTQSQIFLALSFIVNHIVSSWAIYLRCHKHEPYLINSVIGGLACSIVIFFTAKYLDVESVFLGYFVLSCLFSIWAYIVFKDNKNALHKLNYG